jgi:DNA-binding NarL/FixJ family response regulator
MSLRIVVVDDHALVRAGVRALLGDADDLTVVGEAGDGAETMRVVAAERPDVLVLDLGMPGMDGFEVLQRLRREHPEVRVLVLTLDDDPRSVQRAVREGAHGYVLKDTIARELVQAVRRVAQGGSAFDGEAQTALRDAARGTLDPLARLSPRELEVLKRVARGLPNKTIGTELHIGVRTVETHRANAMRKLGLHSTAEVTRFAMAQGLLRD